MYGTRIELLLWTGLGLGSPLLMLYSLDKYPPLIPDPRELLFVALAVFVVTAPLIFATRKKLMPWGDKAPVIRWGTVLALPLIPIMLTIGSFLVANAVLDRSRSSEERTVIVRVNHGKGVTLRSASYPGIPIFLDITQIEHDNVERGDSVQLGVKQGALGLPWISGYALHRMPVVIPRPGTRTSAPVSPTKP